MLICPEKEPWIGIFSAHNGQQLRKFEGKNLPQPWQHAVLSPDGSLLIGRTSYSNAPVSYWNARTGEYLGSTAHIDTSFYRKFFLVSSDFKTTVVVDQNQEVLLIDNETRKVRATLRGHAKEEITSLALSHDGKSLLTGSGDKTAVLWNMETGQMVHVFMGHPDYIRCAAFSPTGAHVATQSSDKVYIWPIDLLPQFAKRIDREMTEKERERYQLAPK